MNVASSKTKHRTAHVVRLLIWIGLVIGFASDVRAEEEPGAFVPARLAVLVHARTGIEIGTWHPYKDNPWLGQNPQAQSQWLRNRPYNAGGMAGQIGVEIADALELKRRNKAMGPYWDSLDQDLLDERLMRIMRCHVPSELLAERATIRDMTFFGPAKAGYLRTYTPGNVIVLQAMMGLSPELDQLRVRVEESIWQYPSRALSKRDLKRIGKEKAARYEPTIIVQAVHSYHFDVPKPVPVGIGVLAEPIEPVAAVPLDYREAGQIWQANDSALLKEQIEKAFVHVATSLRARNGSTCADP